jgi:superfamily II DNA or RNA helicase
MLQSLSMKDYPSSLFETFGFTILDEVHHISSEVFSNALFKIVTRYMVGLSATMERKDGTTDIFKMFLGDVVYKGNKTEEHKVLVRAIEFKTNDSVFNETEVDFRGNPQYSKMIVKLCDYNPRNDFIVRVICDLIEENPKNQIIILGHNRSILYYIHDEMDKKNVGTVGYYLGGMKQTALDESSKKQIIFASYAMAAEGLDIATLSTLIFVTPKTDIIQSVGRILRTKHSNPIVVDIVDKHQLFQNQWNKRRIYYKKSNYSIKMINTDNYVNMLDTNNWNTVFQPKNMRCSLSDDDEKPEKISAGKCLIDVSSI